MIGADVTTFTFTGVDAGEYKLVETTVPPGYNTVDPIIIIVEATYEELSDDPKLLSLTVKPEYFTVFVTEIKNDQDVVTEIETDGIISATIVNFKGTILPGTGGSGTVPFYVIGGILVVGAAAWLIVRRRMKAE